MRRLFFAVVYGAAALTATAWLYVICVNLLRLFCP